MAAKKPSTRYKQVNVIDVHLWDWRIGAVALDPVYGFYVFSYTPEFRATGIEPAPLQMSTAKGPAFIFTDLPVETYKRLPAMLSDALPDVFGNALINRYMADKGISASEISALDMMECRLLHENGRAHFMTKRFDRDSGGVRHHIQSLCAMSHLDYKKKGVNSYSQLFSTMQELALPYAQKEEAFRRMVFNVMGRNCADHTKNLAFRLRQGHPWELTPAYDITFAHNPKGEWTSQHLMSVNGKFKDFLEEDLLEVADRFAIGTAKSVISKVRDAIKAWPDFAGQAGLSKTLLEAIQQQHLLL